MLKHPVLRVDAAGGCAQDMRASGFHSVSGADFGGAAAGTVRLREHAARSVGRIATLKIAGLIAARILAGERAIAMFSGAAQAAPQPQP